MIKFSVNVYFTWYTNQVGALNLAIDAVLNIEQKNNYRTVCKFYQIFQGFKYLTIIAVRFSKTYWGLSNQAASIVEFRNRELLENYSIS